MTRDQMSGLLNAIADRVYGDPDGKLRTLGCAPVKLSIGYISDVSTVKVKGSTVRGDGIVITDSPAVIINLVMDWVREQKETGQPLVHAEAGFGGLIIH